ncbi:MAG TPA: hypothetical protein VKF59_07105 [Candidatus Dormibacteraeota bacterium]|nr:hypothetical protein [Candidatus Dormibacteraeota bacterium]
MLGIRRLLSGRWARAPDRFDPQRVRRALEDAYQMTHGRLPVEVQSDVARIRQRILALVPRADEFPLGSVDLFLLQRIAVDYLPTAIAAYLALPPGAATRPVQGNLTPLDLLRHQLWLVEVRIAGIAETAEHRDVDNLVAHGRFLEEQLGDPSDDLSLPPTS